MLEQLFFITVSVAIFGIMFYKMIKKERNRIHILINIGSVRNYNRWNWNCSKRKC